MSVEQELAHLAKTVAICERCPLAKTRTKTVFGEGVVNPRILFIGEAPGYDEDRTGRPFVGRSGQLLTRIIENGMQFSREKDIYITNLLKCRPFLQKGNYSKDRPPREEEIAECQVYLKKQIVLIQPKIIVALGAPAMKFLFENRNMSIVKEHGTWGNYLGIPVMPIFHPSYVLRNGGEKSPLRKIVWQDIQKALRKLDELEKSQQT